MQKRKLYDLEIEKAVLASMIIDQSIIPNVQQAVKKGDFFDLFNQELYQAIQKLSSAQSLDIVSLNNETKGKNTAYVAELSNTVASSANWNYYTTQLKKYSMFRGFVKVIEDTQETTAETIKETLNETIETLTNISSVSSGSTIRSVRELMLPTVNAIEKAFKEKGGNDGIPTGFNKLDDKIGGIQNEYIILGARPSIGKTSFATNMILNMAKRGVKVGFISAEMSEEKIMFRFLSDLTNINSRQIRSGFLSNNHLARIQSEAGRIYEWNIYIDDKSRKLDDVVSSIRIMKRIHGCEIVFIDHAGMLIVEGNKQLFEKETVKSKTLKNLQTELGIPIVLLSQVGRQVEGKPPCLADLRGSGSYEEDADCVMFIHRERTDSSEEQKETVPAQIIVAKNRDGEIGAINMNFRFATTRFEEV